MIRDRDPDRNVVDAYLENRLEPHERAAFEQRLEREPALREETNLRRRIDESLRRRFAAPPLEHLAAIAERSVAAHREAPAPRRRRMLAAAAGLAATLLGTWLIVASLSSGRGRYIALDPESFAAVYDRFVAEGFEPAWVCADDKEFAGTFRGAFRQALLLAPLPPDVATLGLAYCNGLSRGTVCLLTLVRGEPVVVYIDRADHDFTQHVPDHLHLFRRQLGELVLYELTPWEQAHVLDRFIDPDTYDGAD